MKLLKAIGMSIFGVVVCTLGAFAVTFIDSMVFRLMYRFCTEQQLHLEFTASWQLALGVAVIGPVLGVVAGVAQWGGRSDDFWDVMRTAAVGLTCIVVFPALGMTLIVIPGVILLAIGYAVFGQWQTFVYDGPSDTWLWVLFAIGGPLGLVTAISYTRETWSERNLHLSIGGSGGLGGSGGGGGGGTVRNSNYAMAGKVDSDGKVRDSNYRYVGRVEDDGKVRDAGYAYVGKIEDDGKIRDANYRYAGKVESDGKIRDANYRYAGEVQSPNPRLAGGAALLLLL